LKNPFYHIVPMLFTDYSLPSDLPVHLPMLLPVLFLPLGKGVERREEKRREEKRTDQLIFLKLPFRANYFLLNIPYFPDS